MPLAILCAPAAAAAAVHPLFDGELGYAAVSAVLYAGSFPAMAAPLFAWTRRRWGRPRGLVKATGIFVVAYLGLHALVFVALLTVMAVSDGRADRIESLAPLHALSPPFGVGFVLQSGRSDRELQFIWNAAVAGFALILTAIHFVPLAGKDLVESVRLAGERRRRRRRSMDSRRPRPEPVEGRTRDEASGVSSSSTEEAGADGARSDE